MRHAHGSQPTTSTAASFSAPRRELRYYADANPEHTGCTSYGFEFDLFEGMRMPGAKIRGGR